MPGISNLSHPNKAILEAAILLTLSITAIVIFHAFHRVAAGTPNQSHSLLLRSSNNQTNSSTDPIDTPPNPDSTTNSSSSKLTVNGQDIPMPQNGTTSQTVPNQGGGTTHVETSNQQSSTNSSGTATNKSSTNINVSSNSVTHSTDGGGSE